MSRIVAACVVLACVLAPLSSLAAKDKITVGSKNFEENRLLAEIFARLIEEAEVGGVIVSVGLASPAIPKAAKPASGPMPPRRRLCAGRSAHPAATSQARTRGVLRRRRSTDLTPARPSAPRSSREARCFESDTVRHT